MTLRKINQLHKIVDNLDFSPRNLSRANAYTDQALMNFSYETMTKADQIKCLKLIAQMIEKFNHIRGR